MPKIYTLTGCSGAGKNTIANALFSIQNTIVSVTTRTPRPDENDGYDYYFISQTAYQDALEHQRLIESITFDNHSYGITKAEVQHKLEHGDCLVILDPDGVEHFLNSEFKNQIEPIILLTSRKKVLQNLKHRNDTQANIDHRLTIHDEEMQNIKTLIDKLQHEYHCDNLHQIDTSCLNQDQLINKVRKITRSTKEG